MKLDSILSDKSNRKYLKWNLASIFSFPETYFGFELSKSMLPLSYYQSMIQHIGAYIIPAVYLLGCAVDYLQYTGIESLTEKILSLYKRKH